MAKCFVSAKRSVQTFSLPIQQHMMPVAKCFTSAKRSVQTSSLPTGQHTMSMAKYGLHAEDHRFQLHCCFPSASPSKWKENLCNSQFKGKNLPFRHRVHFYVNYSPKMFRSNTDYIFMQLTVQRCSIQTQITFLCNLQSKDVPFKCRLNYYVTYSPKMFCSNAHYIFV